MLPNTTSSTMILSALLFAYVMAVSVSPSAASAPPTDRLILFSKLVDLRSRVSRAGGCMANVCFAIDGSSAQSAASFSAQKNFVLDLASIIAVDQNVSLAAVQYADFRSIISHLTTDSTAFVRRVSGVTARGGGSRTAIGIGRCARMLNRHRGGQPRKIVLLGDGVSTLGRSAVFRANRARDRGVDLSVVAAGNADEDALKAIAGGNMKRFFEVDNFFDVLKLQDITEKLVEDICGISS